MTLLSLLPFPPALWWQKALQANGAAAVQVCEPFRKMGYRSRYRIAASGGPLWLTIPILGGREQRGPLHEIEIDNRTPWQRNHWRSLASVYRRTAFFDHYEPELSPLFHTPFTSLAHFNQQTITWVQQTAGIHFPLTEMNERELPQSFTDCRERHLLFDGKTLRPYVQPFGERTGFLSGMSILDLLFAEGPATAAYLQQPF